MGFRFRYYGDVHNARPDTVSTAFCRSHDRGGKPACDVVVKQRALVSGWVRSFFSDGICVRIHPSLPILALACSLSRHLCARASFRASTSNESRRNAPIHQAVLWPDMVTQPLQTTCSTILASLGELDLALSARDSTNERTGENLGERADDVMDTGSRSNERSVGWHIGIIEWVG